MELYQKIENGVYFIAEMSANHAGKLENALKLVHAAKEAGADCLKTQTYTADTLTIDSDRECFRIHGGLWDGYTLHQLYQEAFTPWEWQRDIKAECDKLGLDFLSTPFDPSSVDFLEDLGTPMYKIASCELVDIPLISYTAAKGKPMIISCGMADKEEIREAVEACRKTGNDKIILLKCSSAYPAVFDEMNLATIPDMRERFHVPVGLSDHSPGSLSAVVAAALGACVVEKHLCLDRGIQNPDAAFSMEPVEFKRMVDEVRSAAQAKGRISYQMTPHEKTTRLHRRSLFVVEDIPSGAALTSDNVRSIRPADGLHPRYYQQILGMRAIRDLKKGTPLDWDLIR